MTENTIDQTVIRLNSTISSGNGGPGSVGVSKSQELFGRSLDLAINSTNRVGEAESDKAEHVLPPSGQDLPCASTFNAGLEGVREVRALADSISTSSRIISETTTGTFVSESTFFDSSDGADFAFGAVFNVAGSPPTYFNNGSELQMPSFGGTMTAMLQEVRILAPNSGLSAEAFKIREDTSTLPTENHSNLSLAAQPANKSLIHVKEIQASPPAQGTKSPDLVSSTELATHLRVLKSSGGGEARLQLHPAELGRMTVSLITEGDHARVSFTVDNSQAKHAVEVSLPRLRDLMEQVGLNLSDADVSERDSKKSSAQSDEQLTSERSEDSEENEEAIDDSEVPINTQLIDTFA